MKGGRKEGRKNGGKEGRTEGRKEERREGRKEDTDNKESFEPVYGDLASCLSCSESIDPENPQASVFASSEPANDVKLHDYCLSYGQTVVTTTNINKINSTRRCFQTEGKS